MPSSATPKTLPGIVYYVHQVQRIENKINNLLQEQPAHLYIDMLCCQYISTFDNCIEEAVTNLVSYQGKLHTYQDSLLQLVGPNSNEWKEADTVRQQLTSLVQGLEDLQAHAMMGRDEVEAQYKARQLMYQSW